MTKTKYEKELEREIEKQKDRVKKYDSSKMKNFWIEFGKQKEKEAELKGYKKGKQEEREKILKEFEKFWKQFEKDYDIDGRKIKFELLDSDLEFLKTKTKEIIKKNE